jgi:hypothetical protein
LTVSLALVPKTGTKSETTKISIGPLRPHQADGRWFAPTTCHIRRPFVSIGRRRSAPAPRHLSSYFLSGLNFVRPFGSDCAVRQVVKSRAALLPSWAASLGSPAPAPFGGAKEFGDARTLGRRRSQTPSAVGTQLLQTGSLGRRGLSVRSLRLKVGRERNHDIGRFGLMRREAGLSGIFPAGKLDYFPRPYPRPARLCGLHNVKPISVQKKGVVPEQFAQLWNCRMVVRKGLCFELIQGTFDYCRVLISSHIPLD